MQIPLNRRNFLKYVCTLPVVSYLAGCIDARISLPENAISSVRQVNAPENTLNLFRSFTKDEPLPRDDEAFEMMHRWLKDVTLSAEKHSIKIQKSQVYQISNSRPDTNGYMIRITDNKLLHDVLQKAKYVSKEVIKHFPDGYENLEILFGNLFWARQIYQKELVDSEAKKPDSGFWAEELYWLDIWIRVNGTAIPCFRAYWDSLGLISPHKIADNSTELPDLTETLPPIFIDFDRVVMNWHELAAVLGLKKNIFYLRACFLNSDFDIMTWHRDPMFPGIVYLRPNLVPKVDWGLTLDMTKPLQDQIERWPMSETKKELLRSDWNTLINWLNIDDLCRVDRRQNLIPFRQERLELDQYSWLWGFYNSSERINEVPQPALADNSYEGQAAIYMLQQLAPSAEYIGNGNFAVAFENSGVSAAENGVRGSAFGLEVILVEGGSIQGGAVGSTGAGTAIIMNSATDYFTNRDEERARNLNVIDKHTKEICVPSSQTTQQCKECAESSGAYEDEISDLKKKRNIEWAVAAGSVAVACAAGAAVGVWFFGVGAAIGCALAAFAAALVSAGEAWHDYKTYRDHVHETNEKAFRPCDDLGTQLGRPDVG